jgi:hypothetical protein
MKLKTSEDIELAIETITKIMHQAAAKSTPILDPHKCSKNIPLEIKQLLQGKRKARAVWHRTHIPATETRYNQLTNNLKAKLKEMRDAASQTTYITLAGLTTQYGSQLKTKTNKQKPTEAVPPIRKTTPTKGPWARSDKEKATLYAQHFSNIFTPHNDVNDTDIETNLITPTPNYYAHLPKRNQRSNQIPRVKESTRYRPNHTKNVNYHPKDSYY